MRVLCDEAARRAPDELGERPREAPPLPLPHHPRGLVGGAAAGAQEVAPQPRVTIRAADSAQREVVGRRASDDATDVYRGASGMRGPAACDFGQAFSLPFVKVTGRDGGEEAPTWLRVWSSATCRPRGRAGAPRARRTVRMARLAHRRGCVFLVGSPLLRPMPIADDIMRGSAAPAPPRP